MDIQPHTSISMINQFRRYQGVLALLGATAGMLALYWLAFGDRYSLNAFGDRPRQSLGTMTNFSNEAAYLYVGAMVVLFMLYGAALMVLARQRANALLLGLIIGVSSIAFCLALITLYPLDAADIYDYIIRGRMSAVHGLNPLQHLPSQVPLDPFYPFAAWRRVPSAYGPVWEIIAHNVSLVTSAWNRDAQVIAYKGIAVAGYALTGGFIALTLRQIAPHRALVGAAIFLWNPLVIYMTAGMGHNDTVMTACVAFGLYCASRRWFITASVGVGVGVLIKFIPVLLLPLIALTAWRALGVRRWLRYALLTTLIGGGIAIASYTPYWHGWDTIRAERRAFMFTGSVATVARHWLMPILDGETNLTTPPRETPITSGVLANGTLIIFAAVYLLEMVQLWRQPESLGMIGASVRVIFAYLLITSIWFHAWYVIWLIALIALMDDTPTRRLALWFSYLVTWQSLLYNHFDWRTRSGAWLPWLDLIPVAIYMGIPYALIIRYHWMRWQGQKHSAASLPE